MKKSYLETVYSSSGVLGREIYPATTYSHNFPKELGTLVPFLHYWKLRRLQWNPPLSTRFVTTFSSISFEEKNNYISYL